MKNLNCVFKKKKKQQQQITNNDFGDDLLTAGNKADRNGHQPSTLHFPCTYKN